MKTYAVISDIHGNSLALEAVLADIKAKSVDQVINLGDHFFGPLEPQKTADLIFRRAQGILYGRMPKSLKN